MEGGGELEEVRERKREREDRRERREKLVIPINPLLGGWVGSTTPLHKAMIAKSARKPGSQRVSLLINSQLTSQ